MALCSLDSPLSYRSWGTRLRRPVPLLPPCGAAAPPVAVAAVATVTGLRVGPLSPDCPDVCVCAGPFAQCLALPMVPRPEPAQVHPAAWSLAPAHVLSCPTAPLDLSLQNPGSKLSIAWSRASNQMWGTPGSRGLCHGPGSQPLKLAGFRGKWGTLHDNQETRLWWKHTLNRGQILIIVWKSDAKRR